MKSIIANVLTELRQEESTLEERLRLVRNGIVAMESLHKAYNAPVAQLIGLMAEPANEVVSAPKPRSAVVPAAEAAAYLADPTPTAEPATESIQGQDAVKPAVTSAAYVTRTPPADSEPTHEDAVAKLTEDVNSWYPVLKRQKLEELYMVLLLRKDRFSKDLPPTMDLSNAQVVRTLTNHLRHEHVPGYFQLCARLKKHEHLSYLYRRARDKATGCIMAAYPELFSAAQEVLPSEVQNISPISAGYKQDDLPPSGAHHFASLQGMGRTSAAAA